jgi:membrane-associated phospholipid phosphatase
VSRIPDSSTSPESLRAKLHAVDVAVFERVALFHAPLLDRTLPPLSEAASYSRLWFALSALLFCSGSRHRRRTAAAAVAAIGATSAIANVAMKRTMARRRPTSVVPERRRLKQPLSSSFPSGHSASAAAFAGVVGHEIPHAWLPANALGGTVAFSRVYTGVHYPGDVLAGWMLGKSVAAVSRRVLHRLDGSI